MDLTEEQTYILEKICDDNDSFKCSTKDCFGLISNDTYLIDRTCCKCKNIFCNTCGYSNNIIYYEDIDGWMCEKCN